MKQYTKKIALFSAVIIFSISFLFYLFDESQPQPQPSVSSIQEESLVADKYISQKTNNSPETNLAILILSITTLCSIFISFYLYRWRKILLDNPEVVVPEKWAESLISIGNIVKNSSINTDKTLHKVASETHKNTSNVKNMTDTYMELQNALDIKDAELKRYKSGYDSYLYTKFIKRFIRIDQSLTDFIVDDNSESLAFVKRLFEDALDESGVSIFVPNVGDDYRTAFGIADNPKVEFTDDQSLDFNIAEVIECGYQSDTSEDGIVIVPSKVKIYKFKKEA